MIILMTISLWIITFIVSRVKPRNESMILAAIVTFLAGLGAFTTFFEENIIPLIVSEFNISLNSEYKLHFFKAVVSAFVHYTIPYIMLLHGLSYIMKNHNKIKVYLTLFIPPLLSFMFLPYKSSDYKTATEIIHYYQILDIWAVPYMVACNVFFIYAYIKAKTYKFKKHCLFNIVVVVPFVTYCIFANYLFRAFGIEDTWRLFAILMPMQLVLFLYFAKKFGVFEVRLKFENYKFPITKIFEYITDSVIILDENFKIIEINKSFYENFNNFKTTDINILFEKSKLKPYKNQLLNIIKTKSNKTIHLEIENKFYDLESVSLRKKNIFEGIFLIIKDVTEYKRNIILLEENQNQLIEKEKYATFSHLTSGLAHNLKTPLSTSLGGVEIFFKTLNKMKSNDYDIQKIITIQEKWSNIIKKSISNVSHAINIIQRQSTRDDKKYYSIEKILNEIDIFMKFELQKHNCSLVTNLNVPSNLAIEGTIVQILNNLILNALQAYEEIKNEKIIYLNMDSIENYLLIKVIDNANGIPYEIQERLFSDMITTKGLKGTGLGLYITNLLVKAKLKGEIWFDSSNKGTTFFIKIPMYIE